MNPNNGPGSNDRRCFPRMVFPRPGFPPLAVTVGLEPSLAGLLRDASCGGVAFWIPRAIESGMLLPVWVPSLTEPVSQVLLVRVIHIQPASQGLFRVGARFVDRASVDLIRALLD